ncbi:MAG: YraN family protein [Candidatus Omnitrophota bacterium]|nr:MAG: YraN family protein [Candidatus Omnitrophota bacterium]
MSKGNFYETKATEFLKLKGYKIIERNFKTRRGEIDIIAKDRSFICFIEVKARSRDYFVSGKEAVGRQKQEKIKKAALSYASGRLNDSFRFDVLEIIQGNQWREYTLVKAAFDYTDNHIV